MTLTSIPLASGAMPAVGLGVWKADQATLPSLIGSAIEAGYRHFDCACDYGNEVEVGEGLKQAFTRGACVRDDVWVTSKLWNTYHAPEHVRLACERSLKDLRLDVLDLYLMHFPIAQKFVPFETRYPPEWVFDPDAAQPRMEFADVPLADTWRAMEGLVRDGLVRNIGVCNFNSALLRDLLSAAEIPPAMLQVEMHPYLTQSKLLRMCRELDIAVTAFSPLGASSYFSLGMADENEAVLLEPAILDMATRYNKTPAQVVLRWGVQRGTAIVPKTSRVERLAENIALFDFELSTDDIAAIDALNRNRRFNDPGDFCEAAFGTFCPIYD